MTIRVVVGEDEPFVREGIVRVLERSEFEVAGTAADATDLVRKANAHKPDVIVTDIQMPPDSTDDGLRAAIKIRATQPEIGVLVLSQFLEEDYAIALVGDRPQGEGVSYGRDGLTLYASSEKRNAPLKRGVVMFCDQSPSLHELMNCWD